MTRNAIIVHGKANYAKYFDPNFDSPSNAAWLPWLQKQLLMNGIPAQTPEMPTPWQPNYQAWCQEFERYDISPQTILVGHSCGAGFIVRWLSEHPEISTGRVGLVAPWLDPDQTGDSGDFFDFNMDAQLAERADRITILSSNDDFAGIKTSVDMIVNAIASIKTREFIDYGHFTNNTEFPELLEELLKA